MFRRKRIWFSASPEELFQFLLRVVRPPLIADIGSRDATEARRFKSECPDATVLAIEPHPTLFARMVQGLAGSGITPINAAVSDHEGSMEFYVNDAESLNGSLRRVGTSDSAVTVSVRTLDAIAGPYAREQIFLWIDAEGMAWEVLNGGAAVLPSVACIHVEYESKVLFDGQKTFDELNQRLTDAGFRLWADAYSPKVFQGNALYVRHGPGGVRLSTVLALAFFYPWYALKVLYRNWRYPT